MYVIIVVNIVILLEEKVKKWGKVASRCKSTTVVTKLVCIVEE